MGEGAAAVGVAVVAVVGEGIAASIITGAIIGAAIGAVVGGLMAAVTGGSIGKGILFGAVGGAVMGGISGALAGPMNAAGQTAAQQSAAAGSTGSGGAGGAAPFDAIDYAFEYGGTSGQELIKQQATASVLEKVGTEVLAKGSTAALSEWLKEDPTQRWQDTKEGAMWLKEKDLEQQQIASNAARGGGGGGAGHDPANMAQVNLNREKWKEEVSTRDALRAARAENLGDLSTQRGPQAADLAAAREQPPRESGQTQPTQTANGEQLVATQHGQPSSTQAPTTQAQTPAVESTTGTEVTTDRESTKEAQAAMAL